MSQEDVGEDDVPAAGGDGARRVRLHPEEWKDPPGRRVIGEYHKEGAPSMGEPSEMEGQRPGMGGTPDKAADENAREGQEGAQRDDGAGGRSEGGPPGGGGAGRRFDIGEFAEAMEGLPPIDRVIDINTLEVAAFALFRVLFGGGLRIPIKREGLIDMDVLIIDKDVILDINTLQFGEHKLKVWRLVFAYQGTPIMEVGRGVKNGLKIYKFRALRLLLALWSQGRKRRKAAASISVEDTAAPGK